MSVNNSFQKIITSLQSFWIDQGCVLLQPYDLEVGAGTFHPATVLRVLGPDPIWKAAYVQPCRRPTDGRYGENPNRLQHYYQFQVIIQPSPEDIQDLYLESLKFIGLNIVFSVFAALILGGVKFRNFEFSGIFFFCICIF